jgi:hypothetical protein
MGATTFPVKASGNKLYAYEVNNIYTAINNLEHAINITPGTHNALIPSVNIADGIDGAKIAQSSTISVDCVSTGSVNIGGGTISGPVDITGRISVKNGVTEMLQLGILDAGLILSVTDGTTPTVAIASDGTVSVRGVINALAGSSLTGSINITDGAVLNSLTAGDIAVTSADSTISLGTSGKIDAGSNVLSSSIAFRSGDINIANTFIVSNTGKMTALDADVTGTIAANSGSIGGIPIGAAGIAVGGFGETTTGFSLGADGKLYAKAGSFTGNVDIASGTISGSITVTGQINAGATTITSSGIAMGNGSSISIGDGTFSVDAAGNVYAGNITARGAIVATSGRFEGNMTAGQTTIGPGGIAVNSGGLTVYGADGITVSGSGGVLVTSTGGIKIKGGTLAVYNMQDPTTPVEMLTLGAYTADDTSQQWGMRVTDGAKDTFRIDKSGNVLVRGALYGTSGEFSGHINASSGRFTGNVVIDGAGSLSVNAGGSNAMIIDNAGLKLYNAQAPGKIVMLDNYGIRLSDNSGQTWSTAITGSGINADNITVGTLRANRLIANEVVQKLNNEASTTIAPGIIHVQRPGDPSGLLEDYFTHDMLRNKTLIHGGMIATNTVNAQSIVIDGFGNIDGLNRVRNSDFKRLDSFGTPLYWSLTLPTGAFSIDNTKFMYGEGSAMFDMATASDVNLITDYIPFGAAQVDQEPGGEDKQWYTVSGYISTDLTEGSASIKLVVTYEDLVVREFAFHSPVTGVNDRFTRYFAPILLEPSGGARPKYMQVRCEVTGGVGRVWFDGIQLERGRLLHAYMPSEFTSTRIGPGVIETYNVSTHGLDADVIKTGTLLVREDMEIKGSGNNWSLSKNKMSAIGDAAFELKSSSEATGSRLYITPTSITAYRASSTGDDDGIGYSLNNDGTAVFDQSLDVIAGNVTINNTGITVTGPAGINIGGSGIMLVSGDGKFMYGDNGEFVAMDRTGIHAEAITSGFIDADRIKAGTITADQLNIGSVVKTINSNNTTLFHFDGTTMSTQGIQPVGDAIGTFTRDAKFGAGIAIESACINVLNEATGGNTNFRHGTSGWTTGSALYISDDGVNDDGHISVAHDWTCYADNVPVVPGETYTISLYARALDINSQVRVDIAAIDGTAWADTTGILENVIAQAVTNGWMRYTGTFTVPADSATTKVKVHLLAAALSSRVAIDNVQLEQRAFATAYTSTNRALDGQLDYDAAIINRLEGTISFWLASSMGFHSEAENGTDESYIDYLWSWGNVATSNSIWARINRAPGDQKLEVGYNGQVCSVPLLIEPFMDELVHISYRWQHNFQEIRVAGDVYGTSAECNAPALIEQPEGPFRMGYADGKACANCTFDEVRIDRVMCSAEDIKSWVKQEASFFDPSPQIDADAQNVSAANASVTINQEGITVRDGKINVISPTGQTLIGGGTLKVNGLDIGVPVSDNYIHNCFFNLPHTHHGWGDLYRSNWTGYEVQYGPAEWSMWRTSGPRLDVAAREYIFNGAVRYNLCDDSNPNYNNVERVMEWYAVTDPSHLEKYEKARSSTPNTVGLCIMPYADAGITNIYECARNESNEYITPYQPDLTKPLDGNTLLEFYPDASYMGYTGYARLGIGGTDEEEVVLDTIVYNLTNKTDGNLPDGTLWRDHVFSTRYVFEEHNGLPVKGPMSIAHMEIEELVSDAVYIEVEDPSIIKGNLHGLQHKWTAVEQQFDPGFDPSPETYDGSYYISPQPGDFLSTIMYFHAEPQADVYVTAGPDFGLLAIYINGVLQGVGDASDVVTNRRKISIRHGFINGKHKLAVVNLGSPGQFSADKYRRSSDPQSPDYWQPPTQEQVQAWIIHQTNHDVYHAMYGPEDPPEKAYAAASMDMLVNMNWKPLYTDPLPAPDGVGGLGWHTYTAENSPDLTFEEMSTRQWHAASFVPTWANGKNAQGAPLLPEGTEIKYKMRIRLRKPVTEYPAHETWQVPTAPLENNNNLYAVYLKMPSAKVGSDVVKVNDMQLTRASSLAELAIDPSKYFIDYGDIIKPPVIYFTAAYAGTPISVDYIHGETTILYVTGAQVELGRNMSYTRASMGAWQVPSMVLQQYNKNYPATTGILPSQLQQYSAECETIGIETGIRTKHIADGAITTQKLANASITMDKIAGNNIGYGHVNEIMQDELAGARDGANRTFTVNAYVAPGSERLYRNGLRQRRDIDYFIVYGDTSATITIANNRVAPMAEDDLCIDYWSR